MKKKIITSGEEIAVKPWVAFILSLFATGLGQVYSGSAAKGAAFMLLRVLSVISVPCYAAVNPDASILLPALTAVCAFVVLSLASPFEAMASAIPDRKITRRKFNSVQFYSGFAAISILLLALSLMVFFSFFTLCRADADYSPLVSRGDILLVNKTAREYRNGQSVLYRNMPLRIISCPGETAGYLNGRFTLNGTELPISAFTEDELQSLSLNSLEVLSETGGGYRYAVIKPAVKTVYKIVTDDKKYFAAPDDRRDTSRFTTLTAGEITGIFEGVLFSPQRKAVVIKPAAAIIL